MTVKITIKGLDRFAAAFAQLDGDLPRVLQLIAKGAGYEVKSEAQIYPARKPAVASAAFSFVSDEQRRGFFWHLNQGNIQVPYIRTDNLKNRWHVRAHGRTGAVVGNPTPYAPLVHAPGEQTSVMEAIGWRTVDTIAEDTERKGAIRAAADKVMGRILRMFGLA